MAVFERQDNLQEEVADSEAPVSSGGEGVPPGEAGPERSAAEPSSRSDCPEAGGVGDPAAAEPVGGLPEADHGAGPPAGGAGATADPEGPVGGEVEAAGPVNGQGQIGPVSRRRPLRRLLLGSAVAVLLSLLMLGVLVVQSLFMPVGLRQAPEASFVVPAGVSLAYVAQALEEAGLIRSAGILRLWARWRGGVVKTGEYALSGRLSPVEIYDRLVRGEVITHKVTIPEGFTMSQISHLLAAQGLVDQPAFLALARSGQAVEGYGLSGPNLEGYLFPDTYHFSRGLTAAAIIDVLVNRFKEMTTPLTERIAASGMDLQAVVTLASIVEKETGAAHERPLIAGVFLNRLARGMRLDSDPTTIYGLDNFDGRLSRADLRRPTPFNTYIIQGLPPGPIANPGLDAIKAVLDPTPSDFLYFVSRNDGTHHFSRTLEEHTRAVQRYQRQGRRQG